MQWGWIKSALIKRMDFIAHHTSQGGYSKWSLFFWCKVIFFKYGTTERQGLSSCEELFPAVCRRCFPGLPAGHGSGSLRLCSAIPRLLGTFSLPTTRQVSTCSYLGLKISPTVSTPRLVLAPLAGNHFYSVPPYKLMQNCGWWAETWGCLWSYMFFITKVMKCTAEWFHGISCQ